MGDGAVGVVDDADDDDFGVFVGGHAHEAGVEAGGAVAVGFGDVGGAGFAGDVPDFAAHSLGGAADDDVAEDSAHLGYRRWVNHLWEGIEALGFLAREDVSLGIYGAEDQVRVNQFSAVGVDAECAGELEGGDHDFVALGDGFSALFGPFGEWIDEARVFAGEVDAGAAAEAEAGDGAVEACVAHAFGELGHEDVAGFDEAIPGAEVAIVFDVGDGSAVGGEPGDAGDLPDFPGSGDVPHECGAGDEGLEGGAGLVRGDESMSRRRLGVESLRVWGLKVG